MKKTTAVRGLLLSALLVASFFVVKGAAADTSCQIGGVPCLADMYFSTSPEVLGAATSGPVCSLLTRNLGSGMVGPDVKTLQDFLTSKGFLRTVPSWEVGVYGVFTRSAVAAYQVSKGIHPSDGNFAVVTRAQVVADCTPPPTTAADIVLSATPAADGSVHVNVSFDINKFEPLFVELRVNCPVGIVGTGCNTIVKMDPIAGPGAYQSVFKFTNTANSPQTITFQSNFNGVIGANSRSTTLTMTAAPIKYLPISITPVSGPTGTQVTITGQVFPSSGNIISFESTLPNSTEHPSGSRQITSEAKGGALSFMIPTSVFQTSEAYSGAREVRVTPGRYQVSVTNNNGKTNVAYFDVTAATNAPKASITANGTRMLFTKPGDTVNYAWTSTGANIFSSNYVLVSGGASCAKGGAWTINQANGISGKLSSVIPVSLAGCVYNINYSVRNSATNLVANDTVTVAVSGSRTSVR